MDGSSDDKANEHHSALHDNPGGTGFIGSLVIELLLRTTDVSRIYVLARGKRGAPARERVLRLLHSGLFNMVRDDPKLLAKVRYSFGLQQLLNKQGMLVVVLVVEELVGDPTQQLRVICYMPRSRTHALKIIECAC